MRRAIVEWVNDDCYAVILYDEDETRVRLGDNVDPNYWEPTDGNAKTALRGLLAFAEMRPDGVWRGD